MDKTRTLAATLRLQWRTSSPLGRRAPNQESASRLVGAASAARNGAVITTRQAHATSPAEQTNDIFRANCNAGKPASSRQGQRDAAKCRGAPAVSCAGAATMTTRSVSSGRTRQQLKLARIVERVLRRSHFTSNKCAEQEVGRRTAEEQRGGGPPPSCGRPGRALAGKRTGAHEGGRPTAQAKLALWIG